ncbi:Calmodulin [Symbiodinium sp. CCMP2592]|nr:Calmodulin [Symbiodinium sp. CCMP2592]
MFLAFLAWFYAGASLSVWAYTSSLFTSAAWLCVSLLSAGTSYVLFRPGRRTSTLARWRSLRRSWKRRRSCVGPRNRRSSKRRTKNWIESSWRKWVMTKTTFRTRMVCELVSSRAHAFLGIRAAACLLKTSMPPVELGAGRVANVARAARLNVNCH